MSVIRDGKEYKSTEEMFKEFDLNWKRTPLILKIAYRIKGKIRYLHKDILYFFQKIFRGYSDVDMWSLDHFLAKKIYKYLKIFRYRKRMGYCGDFASFEEWNKALDKMLWSMKETAEDFPTEQKFFRNSKFDEKGFKEYSKKLQEGLELFGKYFTSLWD